MPLIPITPTPDHVGDTCAFLNERLRRCAEEIAGALDDGVKRISHNTNHTAAAFWQRVGTDGANVLTALATFRQIVQTYAPDLITDRVAAAGSGVTLHNDGTVTVNEAE